MIRGWNNQGADAHWNTLTGNWWVLDQDGQTWVQSDSLPAEGDSITLGNQYGAFPSEGPDSATVFASIQIDDIGADYSLPSTVCGGNVNYTGAGTLYVSGHVGDITASNANVSLASGASCGSVSCAGVFSAGSGCSFASVNAGGSGQCVVGTGATVAGGASLRGDGWDIGAGPVFLGDMDVQCGDGQAPATSIGSGWKARNGAAGANIALRGGTVGGLSVGSPHSEQSLSFGSVSPTPLKTWRSSSRKSCGSGRNWRSGRECPRPSPR
jgi:hypothetical protein